MLHGAKPPLANIFAVLLAAFHWITLAVDNRDIPPSVQSPLQPVNQQLATLSESIRKAFEDNQNLRKEYQAVVNSSLTLQEENEKLHTNYQQYMENYTHRVLDMNRNLKASNDFLKKEFDKLQEIVGYLKNSLASNTGKQEFQLQAHNLRSKDERKELIYDTRKNEASNIELKARDTLQYTQTSQLKDTVASLQRSNNALKKHAQKCQKKFDDVEKRKIQIIWHLHTKYSTFA